MIILGTPKEMKKYYSTNDRRIVNILIKSQFVPKYRYNDVLYFYLSEELASFLYKLNV